MSRFNAMVEEFEEVLILDKPALFTPFRINRETVPQGYHLYEVRHDDDCQGNAVQVAKCIVVNHWGTLITREEIELPPDGFLDLEELDLIYGTGDCRTMEDYMKKYPLPKDGMQFFDVKIEEVLRRNVKVEARTQDEAEQIACDNWKNSKYVLDAQDFHEVEFTAAPIKAA